ncbi:uncharacterized protein LOC144577268 [Callithrix jacchus]
MGKTQPYPGATCASLQILSASSPSRLGTKTHAFCYNHEEKDCLQWRKPRLSQADYDAQHHQLCLDSLCPVLLRTFQASASTHLESLAAGSATMTQRWTETSPVFLVHRQQEILCL